MKMELQEAIHAAHDTIMQYATVDFPLIPVYYKGLMYKKGVRNYFSKNALPPAVRMKRLAPSDDKRSALRCRIHQVRDLDVY
jgi:hypothetical protein